MCIRHWSRAALLIGAAAGLLIAADSPFAGNWKMDPASSKFSADAPKPQALTARVESDGTKMKANIEGTDAQGNPLHYEMDTTLDGTPASVTGSMMFDSMSVKKVNDHTMSATATKGGKHVFTDKRTVSKDGKTLTVDRKGVNPEGKPYTATLHFDKQ